MLHEIVLNWVRILISGASVVVARKTPVLCAYAKSSLNEHYRSWGFQKYDLVVNFVDRSIYYWWSRTDVFDRTVRT